MTDADLLRRQLALIDAGTPCATVQIVRVNGSIPNELGARMLVTAGPERATLLCGTVGGGRIEYEALRIANECLAAEQSRLVAAKLTETEAGGIGMMCGGQVDLFVEVHLPEHRLVLCGAGHINIALARLAKGLGLRVTVIDDRPEWANHDHFPELTDRDLIVEPPELALASLGLDARSYVVVGTRANDTECIIAAAHTHARYIGVVASKRKAIRIIKELATRPAGEVDLDNLLPRFFGPIGLMLGGRSPEAVALSILAEVQAHRHGVDAGPMRVTPDELTRLVSKRGESL
jgi:xanthine dehydrogenase accessory factor